MGLSWRKITCYLQQGSTAFFFLDEGQLGGAYNLQRAQYESIKKMPTLMIRWLFSLICSNWLLMCRKSVINNLTNKNYKHLKLANNILKFPKEPKWPPDIRLVLLGVSKYWKFGCLVGDRLLLSDSGPYGPVFMTIWIFLITLEGKFTIKLRTACPMQTFFLCPHSWITNKSPEAWFLKSDYFWLHPSIT